MSKKENPTRILIVKTATEMFFERGFSKTTASAISKAAGISTGNLTFHFPTKEHILEELVRMTCDFQWKTMEEATDEGKSSLLAYCMELTTMAAIAETNEQMREIYLSSYVYPMTLDHIRLNDVEKLKRVERHHASFPCSRGAEKGENRKGTCDGLLRHRQTNAGGLQVVHRGGAPQSG